MLFFSEGPGSGIISGGYGTGGTHGGEGGCKSASYQSPPAYGSVTHPVEFGSGGGGNHGGTGGGKLRLVTDRLEVEGVIESNGGDTSSSSSGGGSGGSIWIDTGLLYGGGIISVKESS